MKSPTVSIAMSVHSGADTLDRCLDSIKGQTFKDYEIICINDASTDNTAAILQSRRKDFEDDQLHIVTNNTNRGLTKSLNKGIKQARGSYIARIDADDWWEPTKLEKQMNWLTSHPDNGVVGTWYINHQDKRTSHVRLPTNNKDIKRYIFRRNPFGHSCVVMKKDSFDSVGGYNESLRYGQDLDLWFRLLPLTTFHNINEYLCHRTIDETINKRHQMLSHIKTTYKYIKKYNAPLTNYLFMVEPAIVTVIPRWIRKNV